VVKGRFEGNDAAGWQQSDEEGSEDIYLGGGYCVLRKNSPEQYRRKSGEGAVGVTGTLSIAEAFQFDRDTSPAHEIGSTLLWNTSRVPIMLPESGEPSNVVQAKDCGLMDRIQNGLQPPRDVEMKLQYDIPRSQHPKSYSLYEALMCFRRPPTELPDRLQLTAPVFKLYSEYDQAFGLFLIDHKQIPNGKSSPQSVSQPASTSSFLQYLTAGSMTRERERQMCQSPMRTRARSLKSQLLESILEAGLTFNGVGWHSEQLSLECSQHN
jgi:hypothetical protein